MNKHVYKGGRMNPPRAAIAPLELIKPKQKPLQQLWEMYKEHPNLLILMAEHGMNVDLVELKRLSQQANEGRGE